MHCCMGFHILRVSDPRLLRRVCCGGDGLPMHDCMGFHMLRVSDPRLLRCACFLRAVVSDPRLLRCAVVARL